jgi:hypothetical protein
LVPDSEPITNVGCLGAEAHDPHGQSTIRLDGERLQRAFNAKFAGSQFWVFGWIGVTLRSFEIAWRGNYGISFPLRKERLILAQGFSQAEALGSHPKLLSERKSVPHPTGDRQPAKQKARYFQKWALRFSNSIAAPSAKFSGPCSINTTQQKVATTKNNSQTAQRNKRTT